MRPEYLNALDWARWNHWVIAMWVAPVILICLGSRSWKLACLGLAAAIVACFVFFCLGVDYYWDVKMRMAQTDAEWEDATADTARLYGPIIVGPPFAVVYCSALALVINPAVWTYQWFVRRRALKDSSDKPAV